MDRRTFLFSGAYFSLAGWRTTGIFPSTDRKDDIDSVINFVLTPGQRHGNHRPHPILIQKTPFTTGKMVVTTATFTALQRASHQSPDLPYLHPSEDRLAEAQELADDYNRQLSRPPVSLEESLQLSFPHVLLDEEETRQFFRLHPQGNVYSPELEADARRVPQRYKRLFASASTIWAISRVGFNATRSKAVIGVRGAGGACSSEDWTALSRNPDGTWTSLPWGTGVYICA